MIYDDNGQRKYLTEGERRRFILVSKSLPIPDGLFCLTLAYSGCRISEALGMKAFQVDPVEKTIAVRSLKKRQSNSFRVIPMPDELIASISSFSEASNFAPTDLIWPWCRVTGWNKVKRTMREAGVIGPFASPKGLRHGFAISSVQNGVPLGTLKKWLGHSRLETTSIYTNAIGDEERSFAQRNWYLE